MRIESSRVVPETKTYLAESPSRRLLSELGKRITSLRKRNSWSRLKLARRLGVPRSRVGYWERGECAPPIESLVALCLVLEVSLDELVMGRRRAG
jgi:transcriptional regulator with XRE-family HTH domain